LNKPGTSDACDKNYTELSQPMIENKIPFQEEVLSKNELFENIFSDLYSFNPEKSIEILNQYVGDLAIRLLNFTEIQLKEIKEKVPEEN